MNAKTKAPAKPETKTNEQYQTKVAIRVPARSTVTQR